MTGFVVLYRYPATLVLLLLLSAIITVTATYVSVRLKAKRTPAELLQQV